MGSRKSTDFLNPSLSRMGIRELEKTMLYQQT
jgi:hypothetical protein